MKFFNWENDDKHLDFGVPHSQTHACYLISIVVNPRAVAHRTKKQFSIYSYVELPECKPG